MMMNRAEALRAVQETSFVMVDLNEYLDTHPTCSSGLAAYQQAMDAHRAAASAYAAQYGPLLAKDIGAGSSWQWVETPWPWELEE